MLSARLSRPVRARFWRTLCVINGAQQRAFRTGGEGEGETESERPANDSPPADDRTIGEATGAEEKTVAGYTFDELLDRIARAQLRRDERILDRPLETEAERPRGRTRRETLGNIDELVEFLREENAIDVCVIRVPPEKEYVEYFVVCSGLGTRHIRTMADNLAAEVRWRWDGREERVRVDGRDSDEWMAVDLGFSVVHIMLEETRRRYELEKLWTLGPEHDDQTLSMFKFAEERPPL